MIQNYKEQFFLKTEKNEVKQKTVNILLKAGLIAFCRHKHFFFFPQEYYVTDNYFINFDNNCPEIEILSIL